MTDRPDACSERMLIFLLGLAQFVLIIDMMIVIPLGPDFGRALSIEMSQLGWIAGAYTLAAAFSGIISAVFLDRIDRRTALLVSLSGLVIFTFSSALMQSFAGLVVTRALTGIFGGPCTAICYAIIADEFAPHSRGKAMGKLMGAFSAASVLGVPFGLELARLWGWQSPFIVSALGAGLVALLIWRIMPPMRGHLVASAKIKGFSALKGLISKRAHLLVFLYVAITMFSSFLIIPHLATFSQFNLGFPREHLGMLYMAGGAASFFIMRGAGAVVDRTRAFIVASAGAVVTVSVYYAGMIVTPSPLSVLMIYVLFMGGLGMRSVSTHTLASRVPEPRQRAGFLALVSCVSQLFASAGAFVSSGMLGEAADHALIGFDKVAWLAIMATLAVPPIMWWVERHVRLRDKATEMLNPMEVT